jgi:hypothetical protein
VHAALFCIAGVTIVLAQKCAGGFTGLQGSDVLLKQQNTNNRTQQIAESPPTCGTSEQKNDDDVELALSLCT